MTGHLRSRILIVLNWKMNPVTLAEAKQLYLCTRDLARKLSRVEAVVCPPTPFITNFARTIGGISLGAQNCFYETKGAFTGEVSPAMLRDLGVTYVILGHSERRALGEADETVARKVSAALAEGVRPILCIGESERDEEGNYLDVLSRELEASLSRVTRTDLPRVVIAYEPLWAIGRRERDAMQAADIAEMRIFLRKVLTDRFGSAAALSVKILYGGSVGPGNTSEILRVGGVDGLLVGHESRNPESLRGILEAASSRTGSDRGTSGGRRIKTSRSQKNHTHASSRR